MSGGKGDDGSRSSPLLSPERRWTTNHTYDLDLYASLSSLSLSPPTPRELAGPPPGPPGFGFGLGSGLSSGSRGAEEGAGLAVVAGGTRAAPHNLRYSSYSPASPSALSSSSSFVAAGAPPPLAPHSQFAAGVMLHGGGGGDGGGCHPKNIDVVRDASSRQFLPPRRDTNYRGSGGAPSSSSKSPPASPGTALLRTLDRYQAALDQYNEFSP